MEKIFKNYIKNIDVDYSYHLSCKLTEFKTNDKLGYRTAGSYAEHNAANFLLDEMNKIGLNNIKKEEFILDSWTFEKAEATFIDINGNKQNILLGTYQINFDTNGVKEYEVIYAGRGTKDDLYFLDVKDKIILIDINQREEWWVNYPALQAKYSGAVAVLATQNLGFSEVDEDALNANDIIGPDDAPIFSISRKDANKLKEVMFENNNKVTIKLNAKSTVKFNDKAYNITGEITGKDTESYIIFSSHYDAYFDGFQDNATAVGIMFGIAKALKKSGYKPEKTIIFTALAAEEWGTSNTRYDWSTGAYNQVFKIHPEWQGKAVLNINFELPAFLHNPFDEITSVNELKTYLESFIKLVPNIPGAYTEKTKIITPLTTWADDWSFSIGGIPAVRNDFTSSKFRETHYHTQFDNKETYNELVFKQHHILYGLLALHYDNLQVVPLDFSVTFNKFIDSIDSELITKYNIHKIDELINISKNIIFESKKLNFKVEEQNGNKLLHFDNVKNINLAILKIFRIIQDNLLKLNWEDEPYFPHEIIINNIKQINNAINNLKNNDKLSAIEKNLFLVDNNFLAYHFDKYVWDYFNDYVLKAKPEKLMWGVGRIVGHIDLYDILESLKNKLANNDNNCLLEINKLEKILKEQIILLENTISTEYEILKIIEKEISKINKK